MTLPLELPSLSRGFAELTPHARAVGALALRGAASAIAAVLDVPVILEASPSPAPAGARALAARVAIDLAALPAPAVLEVDPALVVRLVDRLAGGSGDPGPAASLTPVETTALELLSLAALEGAATLPDVETALAPRLARGLREPAGALAIELSVDAGGIRGRARVLLPPAALRAVRGSADASASPIRLPASVRRERVVLLRDELEALAPGDVVIADPPEDGRDALVLPGGARVAGRLDDDGTFHVEELAMTERNAALPVTLEVELARVEISLGDLARLEPGAALPLAIDRRGLVTLRAGDRAVARGELVDVEGAVGVRILSLEQAP